jgi:hypothetical protein
MVLLCGLGLSCGPQGVMAPETESDGETETSGSTGDSASASASASVSASASASVGTMGGTATTTMGSTDGPPPLDSSGDDPPPETTDTGACPYGTEGCLCDVGAACDEGLDCNDEGICVGPPVCRPLDADPHEYEESAYPLDALGCGSATDLGVIATLEGPQTDWYTYRGNDAFMCPERPAAAVVTDISTTVCVFIACLEGNAQSLQCAAGSMSASSPNGLPGCCGPDQAQVFNYGCSGFNSGKDVDVWISVGTDDAEACSDYALSYAM